MKNLESKIATHVIKHIRNATMEQVAEIIERDNEAFDFLHNHSGFFNPDVPFNHAVHHDAGYLYWPPVDIHPNAHIGEGTVIGRYTNITGGITIGRDCKLQGFNFIPQGVTIGNKVFIGPHACFTNVKYPSCNNQMKEYERTVIKDRVVIGAGAIIGPGITIGEHSLIGMGAVVTKDIPPNTVVMGVPAREK